MLTGTVAVVPVREGELASGGEEALAEAGGNGLLVGGGAVNLAAALLAKRVARALGALELPSFSPGVWAEALAPALRSATVVILPASADGRDLAPRLAGVLGWPLVAGAIRLAPDRAAVVRWQGRQIALCEVSGPFVGTLLPGSRSVPEPPPDEGDAGAVEDLRLVALPGFEPAPAAVEGSGTPVLDRLPGSGRALDVAGSEPELIELLETDPAVIDLRHSPRIIAAGAGLGGRDEFELLALVAGRLGAAVGATRVVTDAGVLPPDRQIGTTGVTVRPRCYVALGISGAAQHVGGIGSPEHVISVNVDRSCPMMSMADLALVADAPMVLRALAARLGVEALAAVESG